MSQQHISFPTTPQGGMLSSTTLARVCFPPFEQLTKQQMVQLQDSISEGLHHHTLFNMLSNKTSEAHHAPILLCSGPRASTWLITQPIFPTF
jgi:hypothetical protein